MREEGDILSDCVCLPNKLLCVMSPAFLEVAVHLTADEKLLTSCFTLLASMAFALLENCLDLKP